MFFVFKHQVLPLPPKARYVSGTDILILEDELQRILLVGNTNVGEFVTGVVVALLGYEDDSGKFIVEDICPANMPVVVTPQKISFSTPRYKISD
jgi:DNA polymerase delta subunit 2